MSAGASLRRRLGTRIIPQPFQPGPTIASNSILTNSLLLPRYGKSPSTTTTIGRHHVHKTSYQNNSFTGKDVKKPWYRQNPSGSKTTGQQWDACLRQREEFQQVFEAYQQFWNSTTPTDFTNFSHPSIADVTWEQLMASEETYRNLCSLCNDGLVQLGSLSSIPHHAGDDDNEDDDDSTSYLKPPSIMANHQPVPYPPTHNDIDAQVILSFRQLITFWERIRKERTAMVQALQPVSNESSHEKQSSGVTSTAVEEKITIGKWIKKLVGSDTTSTNQPNQPSQEPVLVQAHANHKYAPSNYHYTRFIARLYYRYPNYGLAPEMWYLRRAQDMQEAIDSAPNEDVLSRKALSWLIRAYSETGKWEQCQVAEENVYRRFPNRQRYLLKYMLTTYWQITSNARARWEKQGEDQEEMQLALNEAGEATIRCMDLLLQTRLGCRIRERLIPLGFHCLVNLPPHTLHNYYALVESLTRRKFGRNIARKFLEPARGHYPHDSEFRLQDGDEIILHLLIQIYSQETPPKVNYTTQQQQLDEEQDSDRDEFDERLKITKHLIETILENFATAEIEDVVSRDTFNTILRNLVIWGKYRRRWSDREEQFSFALKLLRRMLACENWRPTTETWDYLFALAKDGRQSDEVWGKYEVYSFLTDEQGISPHIRTKRVLQAWAKTTKRFPNPSDWGSATSLTTTSHDSVPLPVQRAWHLFHSLYTSSTPPFFFAHNPNLVNHLYNYDNAPDHVVYMLVWQICAQLGAWDTARKVYEMAQEQKQRGDLNFLAGANVAFLQCLPFCPDEDQRQALAQEILEEAIENEQDLHLSFQAALEKVHPELLQKYSKKLQGEN